MKLFQKLHHRLHDGSVREVIRETRWIYHHTRAYRKAILLFTLLGLLTTGLTLSTALLSKRLINYIIARQGWHVLENGIYVVLLSITAIILNAFVSRYTAKINLHVSNELRAEVFGTFLNTDWQSLQEYHSGDLLTRINTDVTNIASSVLGWVPTLIIKLAQFLASLAVIVYYDPTMALIALLTAPLSMVVAGPLMRKMRSFNKEIRDVNSRMIAFHEEAFQNAQSIKAFNLVSAFRSRLEQVQDIYYRTSMDFNRFSVLNSSVLSTVGMLVSYLCLGWGAFRLWDGRIDFGTMVLFIQLAGYLSSALTALIKLVPTAIECTVSAQRIMAIFDLPREILDHLEEAEALRHGPISLHLENLSFAYRTRSCVLEALDLTIAPNEIVAVVGPSGSGKTTLFRILLGLLTPTGGTAELIGNGLRVPLSPSTRSLFAYVPQDNVIFSGTIAETLRLVRPEATDEELYAALRAACAEEFVRALPKGIYSTVSERGGSLSVGQNQRLAIARAILTDAPILLLDEATSALDLETEEKVLENIGALTNKTCLISTHRPSALRLCSRVFRIRKRRLESLPAADVSKLQRL